MHYYFFYMLLSLTLTLTSQGFRVRHYLPGASTHLSKAIFEATAGNYITGGITVEVMNNVSYNRLCIMGLNAQGQITWTKKYGNSKFEYLNNNLISRSYYKKGGNIYYSGCVRDSLNKQIGVLIKFNLNGDTLWQKIYRDTDPLEDVIPQMVTSSVDGGFLITGFFQNNSNTPYSKCLLIKTDANGNELWRKKIAKVTPNTQDGKAIVQDALSKKIVIVGYQYIGNASSWSSYDNVLVLDSLGLKLEQKTFAGFGGVLVDLIQTQDDKFVAVGQKTYPNTLGGTNLIKSFALKFDIENIANPVWVLNGFDDLTLTNFFTCLSELPNGDIMIGGIIDTLQVLNIPNNCLTRLTKLSSNGTLLSNRYYNYNTTPGDFNYQTLRSLEQTADGSWIAAIECINFPSPNPFFFVKFDSTGCDSTLAYCQSQVVSGVYQNTLNDVNVGVFPNPASDRFTVTINNSTSEKGMELHVFDLSGREIKRLTLANEKEVVDISDLCKGVYILRLTQNSKLVYTSKLIKQ